MLKLQSGSSCLLLQPSFPCRYMLTQNPEVEAKVVAELDSLELLVTPDRPNPRKVTYADLSKLEYLQAVIKVLLL